MVANVCNAHAELHVIYYILHSKEAINEIPKSNVNKIVTNLCKRLVDKATA